jgi:hypothetical protein
MIVDDTAWPSPREALDRFLNRYHNATGEHGSARLIFDMRGEDTQGVWTTGMAAIHFNKEDWA